MMNLKYKSNIWKMYLFNLFVNLHFVSGVLIPFFIDWGRINFIQIMFLQSWFSIWIFILEVPTGVIADRFGRKQSLMLGAIINAIAALVYVSYPSFYVFMLGEFLWAMAGSLYSGADEAFLYDSLKKIRKTKESKKIFAREDSFGKFGIMIGAPIGSIIASHFGLQYPTMLTSVPLFLAFLLSLTFKEPKTTKKIESRRYINILKKGIKYFYKNKALKILTLDFTLISTIGYFMIWLYQPMLKNAGVDIMYFGIVQSALVAGQIIFSNGAGFLENLLGSKRRLLFLSSVITGAMFLLGALTAFLPLVLISIIFATAFGLGRTPIMKSYMNKHVPSSERATIMSTVMMIRRFSIAIVNPFFGMMVDWSMNSTMIIIGIIAIIFAFISKVEEEHLKD